MGRYVRMRVAIQVPISLRITLAILWAAAAMAAWLILPQDIAPAVRIPFFLAACVELAVFVPLGWVSVREPFLRLFPAKRFALGLWLSAFPPYLLYAVGTGTFTLRGFLMLAVLSGAAAFWYVLLPRSILRDLSFLLLIAVVMLGGIFPGIYIDAAPKLQAEFLGRILWIRLGIAASLMLRPQEGTGFGFWPTAREWKVGTIGFCALLPVLLGLGAMLEFFTIRELTRPPWQVALITLGSFLGFLWVVALSEEYFLRGLLQQWASQWFGAPWRGWLFATLISGAVHLPFGGQFPNWKFAALAAVAHGGYGLVFQKGGGIRPAMVTHALVVTVWRVFLR